jgi:short-subunit dehydrogenase
LSLRSPATSPSPGTTIYSASKFALRGFAEGLRREVAHRGVSVTIVSPGFIATDMTTWLRYYPKAPPELVAQAVARVIRRPRREVVVPGYYRPLIWLARALPGLVDMGGRRVG